jgi:DNA-binding SARP family transcriptional activator/Tfp pilus assembly protein PilF
MGLLPGTWDKPLALGKLPCYHLNRFLELTGHSGCCAGAGKEAGRRLNGARAGMAKLEFSLLGPLVIRRDGIAVAVAGGRQRTLLAVLLLNTGRAVPVDELIMVLWGTSPPVSARASLQNYVRRLRKVLGDTDHRWISTCPSGYALRVEPGALDIERFETLVGVARAAARSESWATAAARLRDALGLWRGRPLADVDSVVLAQREVPRLEEMRLQALEARVDADLHMGRHVEVIPELRHLADCHPLREHLHGQLMLALYRDGRQAEALATYQHARQILIEELGTEPGVALRELHQQVLSAAPALAAPHLSQGTTGIDGSPVPRELPPMVRQFTGRADELEALTGLLNGSGKEASGMVLISAIGGTAGVGKTALAVHWAHQVAGCFPDGQLYVNLRGYDPDRPENPTNALAVFLRALGVPTKDIPTGVAERAARYRSLLAGRRMLVLLDNARTDEQVRPLLPGAASCAVVVTSRDQLAGLVARDGAQRLNLDLLPLADAVRLLRALVGDRVDADPGAAKALAEYCCRLPLALRVAAELAVARPGTCIADLAGELADQQSRLDLLEAGGDPRTAVRAVFSWSYRYLDTNAARAFRLLGLHPGPDTDHYAVAALSGTTAEQAHQALDKLARANLVQMTGPGRHAMHDLLRAYARDLAVSHDLEEEAHAALTRLFSHYLHTAAAAMDTLYPAERHRRPRIQEPTTPIPPVTDPAAAQAWLDAERAVLVAVTVHAAGHGWAAHATQLSATLFRYLDTGGHYPEAIIVHDHACAAANRAGDPAAEATALNSLGAVYNRQGDCQQATNRLQQALVLFRQTGDRTGEARALNNLGNVHHQQGPYQQAAKFHQLAVEAYRETGDRFGEALALDNLGFVCGRLGRYQQAMSHCQRALALRRELGDLNGQAHSLGNLGIAYLRQGCYPDAADRLREAAILFRQLGNRRGEADSLSSLGIACLRQRELTVAAANLQQALALAHETGDPVGEAGALNGLGEVLLASGQPDQACDRHTAALDLASQIGERYQEARAHDGLGRVCQAKDDAGEARHHWQQAVALYTELGVPEADQVRAQLAAYPSVAAVERQLLSKCQRPANGSAVSSTGPTLSDTALVRSSPSDTGYP